MNCNAAVVSRFFLLITFFVTVACNAEEVSDNLLPNGDFKLGTSSWYARYWHKSKLDYLATEDIGLSTEKSGTEYQLVAPFNNRKQSVRIMTEPFRITKEKPFVLELFLRTEGSARNVLIKVMNADNEFSAQRTIFGSWQKITISKTFPAKGNDHYRIELSTEGEPGTIFIKSAKLVQKGPAVQRKAGDFRFATTCTKPLSLFERNDDVEYSVTGSNDSLRAKMVEWSVTDLQGRNVKKGSLNFAPGVSTKQVVLGKIPLGWYSVAFKEESTDSAQRHSFVVTPRLSERDAIRPEDSFFGTHTEITRNGLLAAKLCGFRWIRLNAPLVTKWHAVEETKGAYVYNDQAISGIRAAGFAILGSLDRTPFWASTGKNDPKKGSNFYGAYAYLPEEWSSWEKYVASMVTHYKNEIRYWDVWNEPDIPFLVPPAGMSNASAYDAIVRKTDATARAANPEARLIGTVAYLRPHFAGPGRQMDFLEEMHKLKTEKKLDIFGFHHYMHRGENLDKQEADLDFTRKLFGKDVSRYWMTEYGFDCTTSPKYDFLSSAACMTPLEASSLAVKYNITMLAKGVEKLFYYNLFFDTNGYGEFLPDVNVAWDSREPRPLVAVFGVMTWLLDGARFVGRAQDATFREFNFSKGKKAIKVIWTVGDTPSTFVSDRNWIFISMDGSVTSQGSSAKITNQPVYMLSEN